MKGKVIKYDQDNIDTDVILPGEYLKLHDNAELGEHAMEGWIQISIPRQKKPT